MVFFKLDADIMTEQKKIIFYGKVCKCIHEWKFAGFTTYVGKGERQIFLNCNSLRP